MAHDSNWINWRKPRLERGCTWQTEHPAIPVRVDKTSREDVLKMLVSSTFDSRLSVMEYLQGLFALLQIAGADVSATKEAIFQATELFQTPQGSKRLLQEIQRPEKRPKYSTVNVSTPLANTTKEESAILELWSKEVRQALLKRNKPLKVWTTQSRLLTVAVRRYKKVVNKAKQNVANKAKQNVVKKAKQRKARGQASLNEQFNRKAKYRKNDSKRKQVMSCSGPKLSSIDSFIAQIFLSATTNPTQLQETTKTALKPHDQHIENNTVPKKSKAFVKPQAKVRPTKARDQVEPRKVPETTHHAPPHRKRKGDDSQTGEPTFSDSQPSVEKKSRSDANTPLQGQHEMTSQTCCNVSTPQKKAFNEPIAKQPSRRYKYIKDNANATNGGLLAEWLRPKTTATTKPRSQYAVSANPTTICLRPQDKWMVKLEPASTYPAEPRSASLRPQDRWYEKSQPRHARLGPYDRWSSSNPDKPGPGFRRPQDKWFC